MRQAALNLAALLAALAIGAGILWHVGSFLYDGYQYRSGGGPEAYTKGYRWAQKNKINDWRRCPETGVAKFDQGCGAYVDEQFYKCEDSDGDELCD